MSNLDKIVHNLASWSDIQDQLQEQNPRCSTIKFEVLLRQYVEDVNYLLEELEKKKLS